MRGTKATWQWTKKERIWVEGKEQEGREIPSAGHSEQESSSQGYFEPQSLDSRLPKWQVTLRA
jgi:hypothetical protein